MMRHAHAASALLLMLLSRQAAADNAPKLPAIAKDIPVGPLRVDLGAQLRLRVEAEDHKTLRGYKPGASDSYVLERVLLDGAARYGKNVEFALQLRDAHAFGSELSDDDFTKSNPIHDPLDVRQAYLQWLHIADSPLGVKAGRQQISYGDQRVFGPGQWGNTGRWAWDAGMIKVDTPWYDLDLWVGRPVENRPEKWPNRPADGPTAGAAYVQAKTLPLRLDLFQVVKYDGSSSTKGESGAGTLRSFSSGFQVEGSAWEWFGYAGTGVYQYGTYGRDTIRAYGFNAQLRALLARHWKPRITTQLTWGSGDGDPDDGVHGTFDGVFGGADLAFYGFLNVFYWPNLRDHEVDFEIAPHERLSVTAAYHYMRLNQTRDGWYATGGKPVRIDSTGSSGAELGQEVDAKVVWHAWPGAEVLLAAGVFFPGAFVQATGEAPRARWMAVQVMQGI